MADKKHPLHVAYKIPVHDMIKSYHHSILELWEYVAQMLYKGEILDVNTAQNIKEVDKMSDSKLIKTVKKFGGANGKKLIAKLEHMWANYVHGVDRETWELDIDIDWVGYDNNQVGVAVLLCSLVGATEIEVLTTLNHKTGKHYGKVYVDLSTASFARMWIAYIKDDLDLFGNYTDK